MAYTGPTSSQLGREWVRIGDKVYQLIDGKLGPHLTEEDFNKTYKKQGLNLDIVPQYQGGSSFDFSKYGISEADWNALGDAEKAFFESTSKILENQYDQGQADVSINADLFNKALKDAEADPDIKARYGDSLALAQNDVVRNLGSINEQYAQDMGLLETKQDQERKALAESEAAAGRVFSGFREQAKDRLNQYQTGVIQSSKRELQNTLNQTGREIESRYGTQGLNQFAPVQAGGLQYQPVGNITGSIEGQKKADIYNTAVQRYNQQTL